MTLVSPICLQALDEQLVRKFRQDRLPAFVELLKFKVLLLHSQLAGQCKASNLFTALSLNCHRLLITVHVLMTCRHAQLVPKCGALCQMCCLMV